MKLPQAVWPPGHWSGFHRSGCPATVRFGSSGAGEDPGEGLSASGREISPIDTVTVLPRSSPQFAEEKAYGWPVVGIPTCRPSRWTLGGAQASWNGATIRPEWCRSSAATSAHNSATPLAVAAKTPTHSPSTGCHSTPKYGYRPLG